MTTLLIGFIKSRHLLLFLVSLLLSLNAPLVARGQGSNQKTLTSAGRSPELAVGSVVVLKASDIPLRNEGRDVAIERYHILKVETDRWQSGPGLPCLSARNEDGWAAYQVVLLDHAIEYFNGVIATKPTSADAYWIRGRLWANRSDYHLRWPILNR